MARVVIDLAEIAALTRHPRVVDAVEYAGEAVASRARDLAPRASGAGAASIHAETVAHDRDPVVRVSWDRDHFYMRFQEEGTENMPANPFLRPAADSLLNRQ